MGTLPYEPGPWTVVDGVIQSASTGRMVAEVVRGESHTSLDPTPPARWRANERLIALAPELADCVRTLKSLLLPRYCGDKHYGPLSVEREAMKTADRLLNGIGRLQVKHEVEEGTCYVDVLVTESKCHIVLNDEVTICKRPLKKGRGEFRRRVSWQAATELYDCPGCKAFIPAVEI